MYCIVPFLRNQVPEPFSEFLRRRGSNFSQIFPAQTVVGGLFILMNAPRVLLVIILAAGDVHQCALADLRAGLSSDAQAEVTVFKSKSSFPCLNGSERTD